MIIGASVGLIGLGLMLSLALPLNKQLWTTSFALLTTGLSGMLFALAVLVGDRRAVAPLRILGANALMAYCIALLIGIAGLHKVIPAGGGFVTLPAWAFARLDTAIGAPLVASALYGLLVLAVTFALVVPLHRRGIHLRL